MPINRGEPASHVPGFCACRNDDNPNRRDDAGKINITLGIE